MHSAVQCGKLNQNCQGPAEEGKVSPRALFRLVSKRKTQKGGGVEQELYKTPICLMGQEWQGCRYQCSMEENATLSLFYRHGTRKNSVRLYFQNIVAVSCT